MLLLHSLCYTVDPYTNHAITFDGGQGLTLTHYDAARSSLRIFRHASLRDPSDDELVAILHSFRPPSDVRFSIADPADLPPEWMLCHIPLTVAPLPGSSPNETSFIFHYPRKLHHPAFLFQLHETDHPSGDLSQCVSTNPLPLYDHPPIPPHSLAMWRNRAASHSVAIMHAITASF